MRTFWYLTWFYGAAELGSAIASAEHWISQGGFNPHQFSWTCQPQGGGYRLRATCLEELAR